MQYVTSQTYRLEEPQVCESCNKPIKIGDIAHCSGFGGDRNPVYFFVCECCNDKSQAAYERSCADVDIRQAMIDDMER